MTEAVKPRVIFKNATGEEITKLDVPAGHLSAITVTMDARLAYLAGLFLLGCSLNTPKFTSGMKASMRKDLSAEPTLLLTPRVFSSTPAIKLT